MTAQKHTILYVDDEEPNRFLFKMTFMYDVEVITAQSADEGFEKLKEHPEIDYVISDMRMPGQNGLDFISEARKQYPSIQYYLLTGFDITTEIDAAVRGHVIEKYFKKPFNRQEIMDAIN